jgi:hypothetical protein
MRTFSLVTPNFGSLPELEKNLPNASLCEPPRCPRWPRLGEQSTSADVDRRLEKVYRTARPGGLKSMLMAFGFFLLLCITMELYIVIRGVAGMREVALQTKEHRVLLELGGDLAGEELRPIWRDYEQVRWLQRLHHWQRLSPPMQFLLHGNMQSGQRVERHVTTRYSALLLTRLQDQLTQNLPQELVRISECADKYTAARHLARLLAFAFYVQLYDSWEDGKQQFQTAVAGKTREQLLQLLAVMESSQPRHHGSHR